MAEKRKKYDRVFKENAVKLSYEKSSLKEFADELGILPCLLTRWRKEYQKFGTGSFHGSGYVRVHPDKRFTFDLEKKSKESELRFEILKKASSYLNQGKLAVYQFIRNNEKKYSIAQMCRILEVGNGGYITWKYNGVSKKQQYMLLLKKILHQYFSVLKDTAEKGKLPQNSIN